MSVGAQITVPALTDIDATVDPADPTLNYGPANAIEVASGPSPCTIVFECNGDGHRRQFSNCSVGQNWAGLAITTVYGASSGTTATAIRLRWGTNY